MNRHGHLIAFRGQRMKMNDTIINPQNGVIFTL